MKARLAVLLCLTALALSACSGSQQPEDDAPAEAKSSTDMETTSEQAADEQSVESLDEIPNATSTGTDIDNACADLPGAKFVSQDMSGGESVDRAVMTFTDEAYKWQFQEDVRTGIYDCEGGRITGYADQGNQMRSGQYTPRDGRLQWRSMEFQMVSE